MPIRIRVVINEVRKAQEMVNNVKRTIVTKIIIIVRTILAKVYEGDFIRTDVKSSIPQE